MCDIIGVPHPDPTTPLEADNAYVFERSVPLPHGTTGRIDLYKRGCFVLEAKQGSDKNGQSTVAKAAFSEAALRQRKQRKKGTAVRGTAAWDTAMEKAKNQAEAYARNLPSLEIVEGRPPF